MKKTLLLGLLFLLIACPQKDEQSELKDVVDLVPTDNEISGWSRTGEMRVAENGTQLYALIDGEADIYEQYGFVKCAFQDYQGEVSGVPRNLELRIFDMGDTTNAKDVYHDSRIESGAETPWTEQSHAGVEARIDETFLFDYNIEFWEERFYVWITIHDEKTQAGLNVAKLFALNVSAAISE